MICTRLRAIMTNKKLTVGFLGGLWDWLKGIFGRH